jgi:Tfp pilus assembly protein PilF
MLGELLLQLQRPAEALTELEAVMRKEPNRFRALYLGAQAASSTNQPEKASTYYRQIVEMCRKGEPARRPELAEARKRVGK